MAGRSSVGAVAAAVAAVALLLAGLALASGPRQIDAAQRDATCGEAGAGIEGVTTKVLRKSILCLANKARAELGTARVGRDLQLQRAAQRHANAMSETDCLASRCPGELDLEARIRKAGYLEGAHRWGYAENTGCAGSAEAMVKSWLASSFHRTNILEPKFVNLGVGIVEKGPETRCEEGLAVFSAVFAWRKP